MADVFISYAREDTSVAQAIAAGLSKRGLEVWWDRELQPGERYSKKIREEISRARKVIVLWSNASVESEFVEDEARVAHRQAKGKLVPYMLEECEIPLGLGILNYRWLSRSSPDLHLVYAGLGIAGRVIRVFMSGPADVRAEFASAQTITTKLNAAFAGRIAFELVRWDLFTFRADMPFHEQVPDPADADLACFILCNRIGVALPDDFRRKDGSRYESGFVYELEIAKEASLQAGKPKVILFRREAEVTVDTANLHGRDLLLQQRQAADRLLDDWVNEGRPTLRVASTEEFETQFERLLRNEAGER